MSKLILLVALFGLITLAYASAPVSTPAPCAAGCDLCVATIGGSSGGNYALAAALGWTKGFNLCVINVDGSVTLYNGMALGFYDLTSAQLDNALSRWVNGNLQLSALGGDSRGGGQAVVGNINNGIHTVLDLKGKNIGVDAIQSGLVYGLRAVLAVYGLIYPRDFNFVICGGTPQRTTCTQQGFVIINGQQFEIDASSLPTSAANPALNTTVLAYVPDFVAPLQSTSIQVVSSTVAPGSPKLAAIQTYMYMLIRAQKYYANPANKAFVINFLAGGSTTASAIAAANAAYLAFFDPINGQVTANNDFTLEQMSVLNVVYVRNQFDGFTPAGAWNPYAGLTQDAVNFFDVLTPGPGKFIDYSVRDFVNQLVAANSTVTTNHAQTDAGQCYNFANGQTVTIYGFLAGLHQHTSGGCVGVPVLALQNIQALDGLAHFSDYNYNAATDTLTLVADTSFNTNGATSRQVVISVSVSDPCTIGQVDTIVQTYTFYHNNAGPSTCQSFKPPCNVNVVQTVTSSWFSAGTSYAQYSLSLQNPSSSQAVTSVQFTLSASDAANLQNIWNLVLVSGTTNTYSLPNWQNGIPASSSYTQAGYISKNSQINFSSYTAVCA